MSNLASHETFTDGVRQVRISYFSRYALCICAAAALLAGCGGSQAQGAAWTPSQQNVTGVLANDSNSELHGETFSASGGTFSCAKHADYSISHFATSGNASGPLPGSFSASGSWRLSSGTWSFQEKFEILSGSQTISGKIDKDGTGPGGSCDSFGGNLPYRTQNPKSKGHVAINILYESALSFKEAFK